MLQNLIVGCASRRGVFKLVAVLAGMAILLIGVVEKVREVGSFLWIAAPLLLLGLAEAGLAAEQRRCMEALEGDGNVSVLPTEPMGVGLLRFLFAVIAFSIWPFYLTLFGLVAFGGAEIAKANKEAAEAERKAAVVVPVPPFSQQSSVPPFPSRAPINQFPNQRFTPSPFQAPQHFATPARAFTTPPKAPSTPIFFPNNSPAPAPKNP